MAFAEVVGHDRIKGILARAVAGGRLPPALLLIGPEGVGKKTLAQAVARALLCARRDGDSCGQCPACSRASRGLHPDVFFTEPQTTVIKIEQIRQLVSEILGTPFEGRARAFVVDEAHLMTEQAANALLKALEEPPMTSHVLLVTASPQALLPTIRSRCQALRFGPLPAGLLEAHLRAGAGLSPEEARLRASLAAGSLGAALAFESDAYRSLRDELMSLLEDAERVGPMGRLEAAERLADLEDPALALTALRSLLRDAAALRTGVRPERLLNADIAPRLVSLAQGRVGDRAALLAAAVAETRSALRGNANKLLSMDLLLDALAG